MPFVYAFLTRARGIARAVALQLARKPARAQVRRLSAVTRVLRGDPQEHYSPATTPTGEDDVHGYSGCRKLIGGAEDEKGYGIRGASLPRRGNARNGAPVVHLRDIRCKAEKLRVSSSYSAETLAAARGFEDSYAAILTQLDLQVGPTTHERFEDIVEYGGMSAKVPFTMETETVFKSLSSKDLLKPTACTLLGDISWLRQFMERGTHA